VGADEWEQTCHELITSMLPKRAEKQTNAGTPAHQSEHTCQRSSSRVSRCVHALLSRGVKAAESMHSCACCHQPCMRQQLEACAVHEPATRACVSQLLKCQLST
jgi:hypothetical protein